MTEQDLQELCGKTEVTPEMLMSLMNDQWYFEQLFSGKARQLEHTVTTAELATGMSSDGVLYGLDDEPCEST
jgi:hypothetical protein